MHDKSAESEILPSQLSDTKFKPAKDVCDFVFESLVQPDIETTVEVFPDATTINFILELPPEFTVARNSLSVYQ